MSDSQTTVTFGVIAYNEQKYLPDLLDDLLHQTYPKELIEVVLVDGDSTDNTWDIMNSFQKKHINEYHIIRLLKNSKRIQPAGWNVVIKNSTADVLLRIDAHARLPEDFIEMNINCIKSGEYVCGGPRENIIDENTPWKRTLLMAEQSMFGAGIASYRQATNETKYVKSLFHAAYRKEVIDKVGLFNETLVRTEDNEYHYRVYKAGYKICYDPRIHSLYQTRNSLKGIMRQKYLNGFWVGKTLFICPECISVFHLVPFAFVMAILFTLVLGIAGIVWPLSALLVTYTVANIGMTLMTIVSAREKDFRVIILPFLFLGLHLSYGIGTLVGIIYRR